MSVIHRDYKCALTASGVRWGREIRQICGLDAHSSLPGRH
jgi:hypothetical protein